MTYEALRVIVYATYVINSYQVLLHKYIIEMIKIIEVCMVLFFSNLLKME